jgi:putative methyltransferase
MQDAAAWLVIQQQPQQQQQQQMVPHPRFARVNTLKASVQQVLAQFTGDAAPIKQQQQQHRQAEAAAGSAKQKRKRGETATQEAAAAAHPVVDPLLPDVLVFPPGTDLHDHPLVQQGLLILQVICASRF